MAVQQYSGLKHTDDQSDAFWLAHLMRLGILPTGYIYPKEQRAVLNLIDDRAVQLAIKSNLMLIDTLNQPLRTRR